MELKKQIKEEVEKKWYWTQKVNKKYIFYNIFNNL